MCLGTKVINSGGPILGVVLPASLLCNTSGKPSTRLPLGRLVEQSISQKICKMYIYIYIFTYFLFYSGLLCASLYLSKLNAGTSGYQLSIRYRGRAWVRRTMREKTTLIIGSSLHYQAYRKTMISRGTINLPYWGREATKIWLRLIEYWYAQSLSYQYVGSGAGCNYCDSYTCI